MTQQASLKDAEAAPRESLAAAIKDHDEVLASQKRVTEALEHASETVRACRHGVAKAEAQLAEAQANASRRLAAVALGEPVSISTQDATNALTKAQNDLDVARATRESLDARQQRTYEALALAKRNVDAAVRNVIGGSVHVAELIEQATAARDRCVEFRALLRWLMSNGFDGAEPDHQLIDDFMAYPFLLPEYGDGWLDNHVLAPWQQARNALVTDAAAPLPV